MGNILFIEPFFGGSHKEFAEGLMRHSSHHIDLVTLPAQNWTWRINGSALHFALSNIPFSNYDAVITSSMIRLSDLKCFSNERLPPIMVYFHENQITYPLAPGDKRDASLCMSDVSTALAADRIVFNSCFHREDFLDGIKTFLDKAPDFPFHSVLETIRSKSCVLYPGMSYPETLSPPHEVETPLIIWNHRWSFDKNAPSFFYALQTIEKKGIEFKTALLGESTGQIPDVFHQACQRLGKRVVHSGYIEDKAEYYRWLLEGTVVVSTSLQENFGMSIAEAVRCGCIPLLPKRLSYLEIIPEHVHDLCLYRNQKEFIGKLEHILLNFRSLKHIRDELSRHMDTYSWVHRIADYDDEIEKLCQEKSKKE